MISLLRMFRVELRERAQRRRFPQAVLHNDVVLDATSTLGRYAVLFAGTRLVDVQIGDYSYVQARTQVFNAEIGPYCSIAPEVVIGLADHPTHFISTSPAFYDNTQPMPHAFVNAPLVAAHLPRTVVGADVWIGQRAMIKAGVKIGVGAVIGAGALVTKDVAPYSIVVGAPAKVLRMRFEPSIINGLQRTRWWELSSQALIELTQYFDNPREFISAVDKLRSSSN
jgi:acetyltransferase-like isoleucine patch superfamily enzyme